MDDPTTASQDTATLGREAVDAALRRIQDPYPEPQRITLESRLVVRGSTSAP